MAKLSKTEKQAFLELSKRSGDFPANQDRIYIVDPTPANLRQYVRFAEDAARFFAGSKRHESFAGEHWRL